MRRVHLLKSASSLGSTPSTWERTAIGTCLAKSSETSQRPRLAKLSTSDAATDLVMGSSFWVRPGEKYGNSTWRNRVCSGGSRSRGGEFGVRLIAGIKSDREENVW